MMQQSAFSPQDKAQLKRTWRKDLKGEVNLKLFTQQPSPLTIPGRECPYCPQTEQLLEELAELSPKLHLEILDYYAQPEVAQEYGVTRIPAIVINADDSSRVKFYGIPAGFELGTIIEDIKTISRGVSPLSMDTRKKLRQIKQSVHIQVFVTPSCGYCPAVARLAHALALEYPLISTDVVEIQEFPALSRIYQVRSVPLTVVNENIRFAGPISEPEFVERVLQAGIESSPEP